MFGVIRPLCNRMFCCIFGGYFYIEIRLKYEKIILLSSSRAFSLSTPTFPLSTPVDNSEVTWKKATKYNKNNSAFFVHKKDWTPSSYFWVNLMKPNYSGKRNWSCGTRARTNLLSTPRPNGPVYLLASKCDDGNC